MNIVPMVLSSGFLLIGFALAGPVAFADVSCAPNPLIVMEHPSLSCGEPTRPDAPPGMICSSWKSILSASAAPKSDCCSPKKPVLKTGGTAADIEMNEALTKIYDDLEKKAVACKKSFESSCKTWAEGLMRSFADSCKPKLR